MLINSLIRKFKHHLGRSKCKFTGLLKTKQGIVVLSILLFSILTYAVFSIKQTLVKRKV